MNSKPPDLCFLHKDKSIGAHEGLAETLNWALSLLDDLTEYPGVEVQEMEVVKDVQYDADTHQLKVFKETIYAIVVPGRQNEDGDEVFTAVPLPDDNDE